MRLNGIGTRLRRISPAPAGLASVSPGSRRSLSKQSLARPGEARERPLRALARPLVPPALRDALEHSQPHGGTYLGNAIAQVEKDCSTGYDRLVVITDEQSHDHVPPPQDRGYVINVASNRNGVGYGAWTHVDGWSEAVVEFIAELESAAGALSL